MKPLLHKIFKIKVRVVLNMKTFREERRERYLLFGRQLWTRTQALN